MCNPENPNNGMSLVFNNLKKKKDFYDFLILSGDNYYPLKNKQLQKKTFNEENFNSGFKCLTDLDKETYILQGNHEYLDIIDDQNCQSIIKQKEIIRENPKLIFFDQVKFKFDEDTKTLIVMIDTTILGEFDKEDIDRNLHTCYQNSLNKTKVPEIINKIFEQVKYILECYDYNKLIFVGHHPILSIKIKKNDPKYIFSETIPNNTNINSLLDFFLNIKNIIKDINKIYYLCADVHFYQKSNIKIDDLEIEQYIVGTGGADLDNIYNGNIDITKFKIKKNICNFDFKIVEQFKNFGYLIVNLTLDGPNFEFKIIEQSEFEKKKYRKYPIKEKDYFNLYRKYKYKYLKLKSLII